MEEAIAAVRQHNALRFERFVDLEAVLRSLARDLAAMDPGAEVISEEEVVTLTRQLLDAIATGLDGLDSSVFQEFPEIIGVGETQREGSVAIVTVNTRPRGLDTVLPLRVRVEKRDDWRVTRLVGIEDFEKSLEAAWREAYAGSFELEQVNDSTLPVTFTEGRCQVTITGGGLKLATDGEYVLAIRERIDDCTGEIPAELKPILGQPMLYRSTSAWHVEGDGLSLGDSTNDLGVGFRVTGDVAYSAPGIPLRANARGDTTRLSATFLAWSAQPRLTFVRSTEAATEHWFEPLNAQKQDGPDPRALVAGVMTARERLARAGRDIFQGHGLCFACHGMDGRGTQLGPDLTDRRWINLQQPSRAAIERLIRNGVTYPLEYPAPMPPSGGAYLTDAEIRSLAEYVLALSDR